jgi:hypothetical protein
MLTTLYSKRLLYSVQGVPALYNDMAAFYSATHFRGSHRQCRSRSGIPGAVSSSDTRIQRYVVANTSDSFFAVGTSFAKLGLSRDIADAIHRAGFTEPAHIQVRIA